MKYPVIFLGLGIYLVAAAVLLGDLYWLLLWPGLNALLLAAGHVKLGPRLLGKRPTGRIAWWAFGLMMPYLVATWVLWHLQRLVTREPACHEVAPRLWLGRRPLLHELPPGTDLVVDLTAEFVVSPAVLRGREYLCLPTLDCAAPEEALLRAAATRIAAWPGTVYIHCAAGHGRSATLAAAVLAVRGLASDAITAERMLRAIRPGVGLQPCQRALLHSVIPTLLPPLPQPPLEARLLADVSVSQS